LTRSIVGTIGDIDTYQLPDAKGFTSMQRYLAGESDDIRQRQREDSRRQCRRLSSLCRRLGRLTACGQVVVLGSSKDSRANARRPGFT
jgi:hypothetical protein